MIVRRFKTVRRAVIALVFVTYFGSMIMANDMALITFCRWAFSCWNPARRENILLLFCHAKRRRKPRRNAHSLRQSSESVPVFLLFLFGGRVFPRYGCALCRCLYTHFGVLSICQAVEYRGCFDAGAASAVVQDCCVFRTVCSVGAHSFSCFPYWWGLAAVVAALLLLDPASLIKVDYKLLVTFAAFFVFAGNMARIDAVKEFLSSLVAASPLLVGVASCQVLSNVPTSMLLSRFTADKNALLIAVNIGGLGTPVASLASLITLGEYRSANGGGARRYLGLFSAINFSFLAILTAVSLLILPLL